MSRNANTTTTTTTTTGSSMNDDDGKKTKKSRSLINNFPMQYHPFTTTFYSWISQDTRLVIGDFRDPLAVFDLTQGTSFYYYCDQMNPNTTFVLFFAHAHICPPIGPVPHLFSMTQADAGALLGAVSQFGIAQSVQHALSAPSLQGVNRHYRLPSSPYHNIGGVIVTPRECIPVHEMFFQKPWGVQQPLAPPQPTQQQAADKTQQTVQQQYSTTAQPASSTTQQIAAMGPPQNVAKSTLSQNKAKPAATAMLPQLGVATKRSQSALVDSGDEKLDKDIASKKQRISANPTKSQNIPVPAARPQPSGALPPPLPSRTAGQR